MDELLVEVKLLRHSVLGSSTPTPCWHFYFQKTKQVSWFLYLFHLTYNPNCSETCLTLTSWLLPSPSVRVIFCPRLGNALHHSEKTPCWMILVAHHLHFVRGHAVPHRPGVTFFLLIPQAERSGSAQTVPRLPQPPDSVPQSQALPPLSAPPSLSSSFLLPYSEATPVMI